MTRSALIVGAGAGLGAALGKAFAADGYAVTLAARQPDGLDLRGIGPNIRVQACDATNPEDVHRLFAAHDGENSNYDVVVYNVGLYYRGPIETLDPQKVHEALSANAFGAFLVAQQASRQMLEHGKSGAILFTGATAGVKGNAGSSPFAMGKFALRGLCQSLARELAPKGIHVAHFVLDGLILSEGRGEAYQDPERTLNPDDIAQAYLNIAKQPTSAWTWEVELRPYTEAF